MTRRTAASSKEKTQSKSKEVKANDLKEKIVKKSKAIMRSKYLSKTELAKREKIKSDRRKLYKKNSAIFKKKAFDLLGNKCKKCGETEKLVLQIDHIKGGGNKERKGLNSLYRYKKVLEDKKKYQILCARCNWLKMHKNKER
jgi:hypothetical protein